jgi:hypothetical protein
MNILPPIVIDLGEVRPQQITELFQESGQLLEDVNEVLRLVYRNAGEKPDNRFFFPIVAVYHLEETGGKQGRRKPRKLVRRIIWPG